MYIIHPQVVELGDEVSTAMLKIRGRRPLGGIIRGRSPLIKLKPARSAAERGSSACIKYLAQCRQN